MENYQKWIGKSPGDLLAHAGLTQPPYDPFVIAKSIGLKIDRELTFDNISQYGSITKNGVSGNVTIWISPVHPEDVQRFVAAHEIGHFIKDIATGMVDCVIDNEDVTLGYKEGYLYREPHEESSLSVDEKRELEANRYAAELLMPKSDIFDVGKALSQEAEEMIIGDIAKKMSGKFEVSKLVMLARFKELKLVPANS